MNKKLHCIMLIDDNPHDNFFHGRAIKDYNQQATVISKNCGDDALDYLKANILPQPDLIFLDINMPGMNGWEFLKQYSQLDIDQQSQPIIVMLTTSTYRFDIEKADKSAIITDYITKPLTEEKMREIAAKYFKPEFIS